jgi:hypothetical protein
MEMDEWMIEQLEQEKKDAEFLNHVRNSSSDSYFKHIEFEIEESEHPSNYCIVDKPIGEPQKNDDGYTLWVDHNTGGGHTGDSWAGTVCMKVSDKKYLMWDYWT